VYCDGVLSLEGLTYCMRQQYCLVTWRVCEGHLDQAFHIFGYLKKHAKLAMVFDDMQPDLKGFNFQECNWEHQYPDARELIPLN
jgi:hypothetical protein